MRHSDVINKGITKGLSIFPMKKSLWIVLLVLFVSFLSFTEMSSSIGVRPVWAAGNEGDGAEAGSSGEQSDGESADPDDGQEDGTADDEPADDEPDDDPADDEPDADPADDDPADDEPDDEGLGGLSDEDAQSDDDAMDEMPDDGDEDDDTELLTGRAALDARRALKRRFVLDGLCKVEEFKQGLHRFGQLDEFARIQQRQDSQGRWNTYQLGSTAGGQVRGANIQSSVTSGLENAGRPRYEVGDIYVYSDGSWEQVIASNQERVEWKNHYGNVSVGSPDFTYKRSRWKTSTRMGIRTFQQTSYIWDKSTDTLWPLALKNKTRFDEEGRWIGKDGVERRYDSFWRCDVDGKELVEVAVGEFETWRIRCARYRDSFSYPKSRAREYRTWYYAPEIEHWVRLDRDYRGYRADVQKELVAILPELQGLSVNPQTIVQVQQQFQEVLEYNAVDQKDMWMSAGGDVSVIMQPKATFRNEDGIYCRQYIQDIEAPGKNRRYAGIGCRSSQGTWYVPRQ